MSGKAPNAPNQRCRIIGSTVGPKGTSVGRTCLTVGLIPGVPHTLWGIMWLCESADGKPFDIKHEDGTEKQSMRAAFAEDWLEVIDDDPEPPMVSEKEKELTE